MMTLNQATQTLFSVLDEHEERHVAHEQSGYKHVPHFGWIPENWMMMPLRDLTARIKSGVSVNGADRPAVYDEVGVLRISAVTSGHFRPEENKAVVEEEIAQVKASVRAGTILVSRANTTELVGASAFVERDYPHLFLPDKLWEIKAATSDTISTRWLGYVLGWSRTRRLISAVATGSSAGMKNISQPDFLGIRIPAPPVAEQRKIARILSTWDRALADLDALIEAKREQKKGLAQRLMTGRVRLPGFDKPWLETQLKSLFRHRKETGRADLPLLSVTAGQGIVRQDSLDRKNTSAEDKSAYQRVCPGDIAYNTMRMWQGVSSLSSLEGVVSPAYTVLAPRDNMDAGFAAHLFKLPEVIHLFHRYSQGLVSDTLNLKYSQFGQIKVTVPAAIDEQRRIATVLDAADAEITALEAQRDALARQKKGLMQRLLTGQVRVTPDAEDYQDTAEK